MLGYFGSLNSFPPSLSKQEEQDLLVKYKNGDLNAKNELIERNLRLVAYVAKKFSKEKKDIEDIISIGTIGLIKAVNSFDIDKNIRLATYAVRCIENEILMVIRSEKKLVNEVSLEEPIGKDSEGNEISLIDILKNDDECVFTEALKAINQTKLYEAIEQTLTKRERDIILLRYGLIDGKCVPQRKVAKSFNISRSYVSRIEKKAIEKLHNKIEGK
jgi:RNA polymerase sporulation-specific sigma factor